MNFFLICTPCTVSGCKTVQVAWLKSLSRRILSNFAAKMTLKHRFMDIITIEKKAFEALLDETRSLTRQVEILSRKCEDKRLQKWLTSEDVCDILKISPRTLQTLRSKHKICYSQMGRKFYYRPEEVGLVILQSGKYHCNNK